jgi:hypothetical protein
LAVSNTNLLKKHSLRFHCHTEEFSLISLQMADGITMVCFLSGVNLNVREASHKQLMENAEIQNI